MSDHGLKTYLQDHMAGATMGAELAAKISAEYPQGPCGPVLTALARDVAADKQELENIMTRFGFGTDALKQAAGWAAEKASRLKLTDAMTGDRDLKQLLEFELMSLGIEGKLALWTSLIEISGSYAELDEEELVSLAKRAEGQRADLERLRRDAARAALAPSA